MNKKIGKRSNRQIGSFTAKKLAELQTQVESREDTKQDLLRVIMIAATAENNAH
jgi:hypothetical protein